MALTNNVVLINDVALTDDIAASCWTENVDVALIDDVFQPIELAM